MDADTSIHVEGLGKRYRLGLTHDMTRSFRETVVELPRRLAGLASRSADDQFWALRDVSFDVKRGEVVGVIGRNGAGKSTLLKILSRITSPTEGAADLRGRLSSLLEVGTGFHPELTGHENIRLNGAILGMTRAEIDAAFDDIVEFSEVGKFLDTPVKRYSSGMRVRLAFAVAAHLQPEILLVDEVLAVGDAQFQRKCLGKMAEVAGGDRTILFVSHNMGAVSGLCSRCIFLREGRVAAIGPTDEVIHRYLSEFEGLDPDALATRTDRRGDGRVRLQAIRFLDTASGQRLDSVISGQDVTIEIEYETQTDELDEIGVMVIGLSFYTALGQFVMVLNSQMAGSRELEGMPRSGKVHCRIERFPLMHGPFGVMANLRVNGHLADQVKDAATCHVETGDFFGSGIPNALNRQGVYVDHSWRRGG